MSDPFTGEIRLFGFDFPPRYWALCNGSLLYVPQFTALYSLIGTLYGGDGVRSFGLPDLRKRTPIGAGRGPGLRPYNVGWSVGESSISLTEDSMPSHNHKIHTTTNSGESSSPSNISVLGAATKTTKVYGDPLLTGLHPMAKDAIKTVGTGKAHNNVQPYLVLSFCICLKGIYPPRQ